MLSNTFSWHCEISRSPIESSSDWPQVCTILIIIIANNAIIGAEERRRRPPPPHRRQLLLANVLSVVADGI